MTQTLQNILQEFTALIQDRLDSAQERVQATNQERMSRYYKGQADTLRLVLHDIEALKFEFGMELTPEAVFTLPVQEETPVEPEKPEKPVKKKGRAPKAKAPVFMYKDLAQEAVNRGVIQRKISHFYHDLLPDGHVKGYDALYQAFEDSEELREAVKKALEAPPQEMSQEETQQPQEETPTEAPQSQEQTSAELPPSDPHDQQMADEQTQSA